MPNHFINADNSIIVDTNNTNALNLATGDQLLVTYDGVLASFRGSGVHVAAGASSTVITVLGHVYGNIGILSLGQTSIELNGHVHGNLLGISLTGTSNYLSVGAQGRVNGAIQMGGQDTRIENSGTIESISMTGSGAILTNSGTVVGNIGLSDGTSDARIINAGKVVGSLVAGSATNGLVMNNSGEWHGSVLSTTAGQDRVTNTGLVNGQLILGSGGDLYEGRHGEIRGLVSGDAGNDNLTGGNEGNVLLGGAGNDELYGLGGDDELDGGGGDDLMHGGKGDDLLLGGQGKDHLIGGRDDDTLIGGRQADLLTGNQGADRFVFNNTAESATPSGQRDTITDFQRGLDLIDISTIDANTTVTGNQAFSFIGAAAFTAPGQIRAVKQGGNTIVQLSNDGDTAAEMVITLRGLYTLEAADFVF